VPRQQGRDKKQAGIRKDDIVGYRYHLLIRDTAKLNPDTELRTLIRRNVNLLNSLNNASRRRASFISIGSYPAKMMQGHEQWRTLDVKQLYEVRAVARMTSFADSESRDFRPRVCTAGTMRSPTG